MVIEPQGFNRPIREQISQSNKMVSESRAQAVQALRKPSDVIVLEPGAQEAVWVSGKLTDALVVVIKALHKEKPHLVFHVSYPRYNKNDVLLKNLIDDGIKVQTFDCPAYQHAHISKVNKLLGHPKIRQTMQAMGVSPPVAILDEMIFDQALGCDGAIDKLIDFMKDIWRRLQPDYLQNAKNDPSLKVPEHIELGLLYYFNQQLGKFARRMQQIPEHCKSDLEQLNEWQLGGVLNVYIEPKVFQAWLDPDLVLQLFEDQKFPGCINVGYLVRNGFLGGDAVAIRNFLGGIVKTFKTTSKDAFVAACGRRSKVTDVLEFIESAFRFAEPNEDKLMTQLTQNMRGFYDAMGKLRTENITSLEDLNARQAKWVREPFPGPDANFYYETKPILKSDFLKRLDYNAVLSMFCNTEVTVERLAKLGYLGGNIEEIKGNLGWISKLFTAVKSVGSMADHCNFMKALFSSSPEYKDHPWEDLIDVFLENDCVPPVGAPRYVANISDMEKDDDFSNAAQATAFPNEAPKLFLQCPVYHGKVVNFYKRLARRGRKRKAEEPEVDEPRIGKRVFYSKVVVVIDKDSNNFDKILQKGYPDVEDLDSEEEEEEEGNSPSMEEEQPIHG